jgi:transcriptional regulator with XRE-family HTH domain
MFAIDPNAPPIAGGYSRLSPPGCNIRRLRKAKGWTHQQLADAMTAITGTQTSRSTPSRYERNVDGFTWANMRAVAQALGTSLEDLMTPPHLLNLPIEIRQTLELPADQQVKILAVIRQALLLIHA